MKKKWNLKELKIDLNGSAFWWQKEIELNKMATSIRHLKFSELDKMEDKMKALKKAKIDDLKGEKSESDEFEKDYENSDLDITPEIWFHLWNYVKFYKNMFCHKSQVYAEKDVELVKSSTNTAIMIVYTIRREYLSEKLSSCIFMEASATVI